MRIQVTGGPWPERVGCYGSIVPPAGPVYPWVTRGKGQVVVLLDDDPLATDGHWAHTDSGFTCVYDIADLSTVGAP